MDAGNGGTKPRRTKAAVGPSKAMRLSFPVPQTGNEQPAQPDWRRHSPIAPFKKDSLLDSTTIRSVRLPKGTFEYDPRQEYLLSPSKRKRLFRGVFRTSEGIPKNAIAIEYVGEDSRDTYEDEIEQITAVRRFSWSPKLLARGRWQLSEEYSEHRVGDRNLASGEGHLAENNVRFIIQTDAGTPLEKMLQGERTALRYDGGAVALQQEHLPPFLANKIAFDVSRQVAELNAENLFHCDIKASNICVRLVSTEKELVPKATIIDFETLTSDEHDIPEKETTTLIEGIFGQGAVPEAQDRDLGMLAYLLWRIGGERGEVGTPFFIKESGTWKSKPNELDAFVGELAKNVETYTLDNLESEIDGVSPADIRRIVRNLGFSEIVDNADREIFLAECAYSNIKNAQDGADYIAAKRKICTLSQSASTYLAQRLVAFDGMEDAVAKAPVEMMEIATALLKELFSDDLLRRIPAQKIAFRVMSALGIPNQSPKEIISQLGKEAEEPLFALYSEILSMCESTDRLLHAQQFYSFAASSCMKELRSRNVISWARINTNLYNINKLAGQHYDEAKRQKNTDDRSRHVRQLEKVSEDAGRYVIEMVELLEKDNGFLLNRCLEKDLATYGKIISNIGAAFSRLGRQIDISYHEKALGYHRDSLDLRAKQLLETLHLDNGEWGCVSNQKLPAHLVFWEQIAEKVNALVTSEHFDFKTISVQWRCLGTSYRSIATDYFHQKDKDNLQLQIRSLEKSIEAWAVCIEIFRTELFRQEYERYLAESQLRAVGSYLELGFRNPAILSNSARTIGRWTIESLSFYLNQNEIAPSVSESLFQRSKEVMKQVSEQDSAIIANMIETLKSKSVQEH